MIMRIHTSPILTTINLYCEDDDPTWNRELLYTALLNSQDLPSRKSKAEIQV